LGIFRRIIKAIFEEGKNNNVDIIVNQAQDLVCSINDSMNIANQSKEISIRENELKKARLELEKIKELVTKYPFITLERLEAVEASIIKVAYNDIADPSTKSVSDNAESELLASQETSRFAGKRLIGSEEQAILLSIQSCFRVVNESIEIARKSKNHETKVSRLGVARNTLKEAQKQARQFSLDIEGFDKAEAEINRIDEAIRAGTPTEIAGMQEIEINTEFSSPARNLLKEATALKKEKKYIEACEKLRKAYSADGAENLMIEDRLRLPMYLQLAGKNDEGWDELNRLLTKYVDPFSQPRIANQMKIFLRKENNETALNPVRVILRGDKNPRVEAIQESQNNITDSWKKNQDVANGLKFSATMQLRTPLRVLMRHNEIHNDINSDPPKIAKEMWEGIWTLKTMTFRELGIDIDELPNGTMASGIGQVKAEDYLPFLIAVRQIVELTDSIECRIKRLREQPMVGNWRIYVEKHNGIENIIQRFFPQFIGTIPKINNATITELSCLGLNTPNLITEATNETLLNIKGIGQEKLKTIREYCTGISSNRDAERFETVTR
jgi:hypothetical protein